MRQALESVYYRGRDAVSPTQQLRVGEVSVQLPQYYLSEMKLTIETESLVLTDFVSTIDEADTVWDVGTRCGLYALCAARQGATTIAIEAYPPTARRGRRYAELNDVDVIYHVIALGDGSERMVRRGGATDEKPTRKGDDLVASGWQPPTVVKMDIEGAELDALRGLESTLQEYVEALYVEVHPELLDGDASTQEVKDVLAQTGFEVELLADRELDNWQPIFKATATGKRRDQ